MNILFLYERPIIQYMGGVQRVTHVLAEEMQRRGHNIVYLSTDYERRAGSKGNNSEGNNSNDTAIKQYFVIYNKNRDVIAKEYYNILKEEKIDIVINQKPHRDTDYLLSITPKEIKTISCIHIQPFNTQTYSGQILKHSKSYNWKNTLYLNVCRLLPWYYKQQERNIEIARINKALEVSDYLCLLSEHFIPRVLKYMPHIDKNRLIAVNNPAIIENITPQELVKEKIIIWVGRQSNAQKNVPAFIDVWKIVSQNNRDWRAVIIGSGSDMEYNKTYAKKNGVERLEFAGLQKNVEQFYKKANFIGMTSTYEGWGMVLTEAMSYGCIPFAYDTYESVHDIIDDGKNGIIVKPFDKKEMARRIQEIIDDNEKFATMQNAALEKVKTFSVENIVDKWEEIFKL